MRNACVVGVIALTVIGCGGSSGPELIDVSGTVSYQGQPIKDGAIKFSPVAGSDAPARSVAIVEGEYAASGRSALGVGQYEVQIMSYVGELMGPGFLPVSDPESAKKEKKPREQVLPEKYNTKSEIEPFTVPSGSGPITQNYDLE